MRFFFFFICGTDCEPPNQIGKIYTGLKTHKPYPTQSETGAMPALGTPTCVASTSATSTCAASTSATSTCAASTCATSTSEFNDSNSENVNEDDTDAGLKLENDGNTEDQASEDMKGWKI